MGVPRPPDDVPAFALTLPGIGPILRRQALDVGLRPGGVESDGRADVVPLGTVALDALSRLRTAEDMFVDVGLLASRQTAAGTARGLDRRQIDAGLTHLYGARGRRPRSVRVIVRVRSERHYLRTSLRDALTARIGRMIPGWRPVGGVAEAELWVLQTGPSVLRVGLRMLDLGARRHELARAVERPGALRPAAAAAMVFLAGAPTGVLLDPCCGTGTLLSEARAAGWKAVGGDIDVDAVTASRLNTGSPVVRLDARRLPFVDNLARAVVSNLPFGGQHRVQGAPVAWYRRSLAEASRVAPLVVVLAPPSTPFRQALGRLPFNLRARHELVLLGYRTSVWVLERRPR